MAAKRRRSTKARGKSRTPTRKATRAIATRAIDARHKGLAVAVQPPVDSDPAHLLPAFTAKLQAALAQLAAANTPFKLVEGFRTRERQQWLYGSGRLAAPFGRPGPIVTNADGVTKLSRHQGNGTAGSGTAADCYPTRDGRVFIPKSSDPVWNAYADAVQAQGLIAGHRFKSIKDSPHCELPRQ